VSNVDKKVIEYFGPRLHKGEVGIEIEVEGKNLWHNNVDPYWTVHADGSLRGEDNAEYVLTRPIDRKAVPEALKILFETLARNGSKVRKDSPNTSVHVHLNVQQFTIKQVINFICLWYIFEHQLVSFCGEEREGNLFCLRGSDAEVAMQRLQSCLRNGKFTNLNDQDGLRYTALNYTALGKFGSLEVRSLAGIYDEGMINIWVNLLLALKDYSQKFENPSDIIVEFSRTDPQDFMDAALGQNARLIRQRNYRESLREGMRFTQGLAYCVNWNKASQKKQLDEDPAAKVPPIGARNGRWIDIGDGEVIWHEEQAERPVVRPAPRVNPFIRDAAGQEVPRRDFNQVLFEGLQRNRVIIDDIADARPQADWADGLIEPLERDN